MPSPQRSKAPWRWAIVAISALATAGFWGAVVNGPAPTHASPPPTPVVVQQAPTLSQMINEDEADDGFASASVAMPPAQSFQPRFRTRGS
jgi:hypothetical protein